MKHSGYLRVSREVRVNAFRAVVAAIGMWLTVLALAAAAAPGVQAGGWQLPPTAADEKNPIEVTGSVLLEGRRLYTRHCQRCHDRDGKGKGPDAPSGRSIHLDLTDASRADRNPDGVVFYKIWNGRESPKMPAFKDDLSRDEVWTLVAYAQRFRGR